MSKQSSLSDRILKKCGGVPLAIITMASLLLGKSREEWIKVCNSPGFCHDKDDMHMKNTMHILSLSYYDLPCHLKTCLLFLSVFPEDSLVDKDSLIWKWIAEGFVVEKPGRGLFEVREEYFRDLINKSMIMAVDSKVYGIIDGCRVHDMVLDLIVSISHEENFVSVDGILAQSHTRRLVPKNRELDLTRDTDVNLPQLRSFIVLQCDIAKWALHRRLKLICVLALEGCTFREGCHSLKHIGNLLHLRFLGIQGFGFQELAEGIGALKFLQTLNLGSTGIRELPRSIGRLTRFLCLRAQQISASDGTIGKLTSLQELLIGGHHNNDESQRKFVLDLRNLCELRVLRINNIRNMDECMQIDLVQSLGNLKKVQYLTLGHSISIVNMNAWDAAVPSRDLRCLFLPNIMFPKFLSWINSEHLPSLSHLEIRVDHVDEEGLKALGWLPKLVYLNLFSWGAITSTNSELDGYFQKLRSLVLPYLMVEFVANEDSTASFTFCPMRLVPAIGRKGNKDDCRAVPAIVMPTLEELEFRVNVKELMLNNVIGFDDLGLEYLHRFAESKFTSGVMIHLRMMWRERRLH